MVEGPPRARWSRLVDLLESWVAATGEDVDRRLRAATAPADPLDRDRGRARPAAAPRLRRRRDHPAASPPSREPGAIRVVTSDRWLADRVHAAGATVEPAAAFRTQLEEPLMAPVTRYARSGGASIAYQVVGEGALDLLFLPGWISQIEQLWEAPAHAALPRAACRASAG